MPFWHEPLFFDSLWLQKVSSAAGTGSAASAPGYAAGCQDPGVFSGIGFHVTALVFFTAPAPAGIVTSQLRNLPGLLPAE